MRSLTRARWRWFILLLSMALMAAACGDGVGDADEGPEPTQEGDPETTEIEVITPFFSTFAHFGVADEQGFWEDHGLTVNVIEFEGGAALAVENAIVRNEADLAYTTLPTAQVLATQGQYLKLFGTGSYYGTLNGANFSGNEYVVRQDSDINAAADLEGARIGVIARGGLEEALITKMLNDVGVDSDSVELVESFWADHPALLDAGEIDVSMVIYPFALAYQGDEYCSIGDYFLGSPDRGLPYVFGPDGLGNFPNIANEEFVEQNPNTIRAFIAGLDDAIAWIEDNREEFLPFAAEFGNTDVETLEASPPMLFTNYRWVEERQLGWLEQVQDVMMEAGFVQEPLDLDRMTTLPFDEDLSGFAEPQAVQVGDEDSTFRPPACE